MSSEHELPEEVRKFIGSEMDRGWGADEVCKPLIRRWCEALEDGNPLYSDEELAKENGYDGVIAPPTMALTLCQPPLWPPQAEMGHVGQNIPSMGHLTGGLVSSIEWEFYCPILIGDRLRSVEKLVSISGSKTTRLGTGHFMTVQVLCYNQRGTLVAMRTSTNYRYRPKNPVEVKQK